MQKISEPAFVRQLQMAIDQGQVVLIPTPVQRPVPAKLPRNRRVALAATLCLSFGLTHGEARMLLWLLTHNHGSKKALRTAASAPTGQTSTNNTVKTTIFTLRRKLQPHGIGIVTLSGIGYGLAEGARDKIDKILADRGVELAPTRPQAKAEAT